jgi:hypothetical protein
MNAWLAKPIPLGLVYCGPTGLLPPLFLVPRKSLPASRPDSSGFEKQQGAQRRDNGTGNRRLFATHNRDLRVGATGTLEDGHAGDEVSLR